MKLITHIETITREEAFAVDGYGHWGIRLTAEAEIFSWLSPMLGDSGASTESYDALKWMMECHAAGNIQPEDMEDGPDECIWRDGENFFYASFTYE